MRKVAAPLPIPEQVRVIRHLRIKVHVDFRQFYDLGSGTYPWKVLEALGEQGSSGRECTIDLYRGPFSQLLNVDDPFFRLLTNMSTHNLLRIKVWSRVYTGGRITSRFRERGENGRIVYFNEETEETDRQLSIRFRALLDPYLGPSKAASKDVGVPTSTIMAILLGTLLS